MTFMGSLIQNLFTVVKNGANSVSFVDLHLYLLLLFSGKMFGRAPVAAQHGPEWPVALRQVSKLPSVATLSHQTRPRPWLQPSGCSVLLWRPCSESVWLNSIILSSAWSGFSSRFWLLCLVCSHPDIRSSECFARIHLLPRTQTPASVMKHWLTSCGSSWTLVCSVTMIMF